MTRNQKVLSHRGLRNMLAGSVSALILLIGITAYGFFKQDQSEVTGRWVIHTQKVIAKFQELQALVYESMTAQRGYIITSQPRHRDIFLDNYHKLDRVFATLSNLTQDNKRQQVGLQGVKAQIDELRVYHLFTLDLIKGHQDEKAIKIVNSGKGQAMVENIKRDIQLMIEREEELLEQRLEKNEHTHKLSYTLVVTSSIFAILFIIVALVLMYREFSRRLKIQQDLSKASELQEAVLKATPFALVTISTEGEISLFNPAAEKLLGYKSQEVIGKNPGIWHIGEEIAAEADKLSQRFGTKIPVNHAMTYLAENDIIESTVWTMVKKDGTRIKASLTLSPLKDTDGEIYGFIGLSYDVTKQLEYEKNIIEAREQALAGTRAKSEFLANMSHEIRTPMNAIMGMAELLIEADLSDEQRKYVEIFQRAGDSLLNIINDILDLSKIEAGQFELDRIPFRLTSIVQKSVEIIALKAHQKGLELAVDLDENLNDAFIGDPNRIRQILLNLLGNSVKFTKKGEIILRIKGRPLPQNRQEITIEVNDTGIGMSPENVKKLFERFAQADSSITKEFGGTGLGLSITKRLTELMNGDISVQSNQGIGTKFILTLNLEVDETPLEEMRTINLKNVKILVVDDTRTNRLIIRKLLEHMGAIVYEAEDGKGGLALVQEHKLKGKPFQIILLDSRMPEMDGFKVATAVQESEELKGPIMMMLTSDNRPGELQRARNLGLKSYIVKPILKAELIDAISDALNQIPLDPPKPEAVVEVPTEAQLRILLVDDNDENRLVVRSFLKAKPWQITEARNGLEAVEFFKSGKFDIVFMDMQMPVMDGYTATAEIRKFEKEQGMSPGPILALTAYALKEEVDKSYSAGCNGHLSKPISKAALLTAVNEFTTEIEVTVDKDLADLIPDYLASRAVELKNLQVALDENNYALIQSLGHKLRGSAGSYGFDLLSEVGKELEENAKVQGRVLIEKALAQYQHYLRRVKIKV